MREGCEDVIGPLDASAEVDFAHALREAVAARGLSLDRVRAHLLEYGHDVSVATLSYWQTGRSVPVRRSSVQALGALEVILEVPRGSLAGRLRSTRGRGAERVPAPLAEHPAAAALIDRLGLTWDGAYQSIETVDIVSLGPDRRPRQHLVREIIQAHRDGFQRLAVVHTSPGPMRRVVPISGENCRVARVLYDDDAQVTVAELVLDQVLQSGDPYLFEYRIVAQEQDPRPPLSWRRTFPTPMRLGAIEVSFLPDDRPQQVRGVTRPDGGAEQERHLVTRGDCVMLMVSDWGPGEIEIAWEWPADDPATEVLTPG